MGGVLRYKWEAYYDTNGRSTANISLSSESGGIESTAIQIEGIVRYFFESSVVEVHTSEKRLVLVHRWLFPV